MKKYVLFGFVLLAIISFTRCEFNNPESILSSTPEFQYRDSLGDEPLNQPDTFYFNGYKSGLYPWGNELIENDYKLNYISACKTIRALDSSGIPNKLGKVVVLGIGGSNQERLYTGIRDAQLANSQFGKKLIFANGGIGGKDLPDIIDPTASYWSRMRILLDSLGVTPEQVQVVFVVEDDFPNTDTTINRAFYLRDQFVTLLNTIMIKYVNCKMVLFGDRGYNNYANLSKYSEPKGYLNGWGVKFLVEDYINGLLPTVPFINWLDYYWANGTVPRWDGLTYLQTDFEAPDYAHYTPEKADELGLATHNKLIVDPGAIYWYK